MLDLDDVLGCADVVLVLLLRLPILLSKDLLHETYR
jgi:hypothetical protein